MDWITWLLSFVGVIGLIFLLFYALKKLNKRVSVGSGSRLRVLDRVSLGKDGMLLVVSAAGKLMLIGVTPQRVEKLCDLDQTEEDYLSSLSENNPQDFKSVLYSVFSKKSGEASENENGESVGCDGGKNGAAEEDNEADSDEVRH